MSTESFTNEELLEAINRENQADLIEDQTVQTSGNALWDLRDKHYGDLLVRLHLED